MSQDQILSIMKMRGPILPTELTSLVKKDSMIVGAMLSDLIAQKKVKYTHAKWGSSPLYYLPDQKEQIQKIYPKLNEKDRQAYDMLKEQKVVRDDDLSPLHRACMRSIKDFAIPITVKTTNGQEQYWMWYMLSTDEASSLLRERLTPKTVKEIPREQVPQEQVPPKEPVQEQPASTPEQTTLVTPQKTLTNTQLEDETMSNLAQKLTQQDIVVEAYELVRKASEYDVIVRIRTKIGELKYFAKYKQKKKISDADLTQCFVRAQLLRLPALFITTGDLTKKAKELQDELSIVVVNVG
ncbi:MAG: hypothetical protein ACMXYF_03485 [Candidatus Woesearchaeota archaeon]